MKTIRYGQYLGAIRRHSRQVSYNDVFALERAQPPTTAGLRLVDLHRLLTPYFSLRVFEQLRAVIPLAFFLIGFQALALRTSPDEAESIALGIGAIIVGLTCFMEGVKLGLMPLAENIGFQMPARSSSLAILLFSGVLGVAATFAEPAIGALQAAGSSISAAQAPLMKVLLGPKVAVLVGAVAASVGLAVILGILRSMFGWRLKHLIFLIVPISLALTAYVASSPTLHSVIGLAWDCGAITTGPVTVPLVLAVGVGIAAAAGRGNNPLAGFGVVTLASLLPIIGVLVAALGLEGYVPLEGPLASKPAVPAWHERPPATEVITGTRSVLPLVILLYGVQRLFLKLTPSHPIAFWYGVAMALLGMVLFNLGLTSGLVELGNQAGTNVPWAFSPHRLSGAAPLYPRLLGYAMVLLFAFSIGYGATAAEPALNAMGITVENLTDGAFKKRLLVHSVALGVGVGAALGVAKIIFSWGLAPMLWTLYSAALLLTYFAREELVNLAWDSAGVTTGPITVPLLLSLGVGLAQAVGAQEGFGILALCSVGPIITVLGMGLWVERRSPTSRKRKGKARK